MFSTAKIGIYFYSAKIYFYFVQVFRYLTGNHPVKLGKGGVASLKTNFIKI